MELSRILLAIAVYLVIRLVRSRLSNNTTGSTMSHGKVIEVDNPVIFKALTSSGPVVVDFFATWCGPCKAVAPVVGKLSETYTNVRFIQVDVDKVRSVAQQLEVRAMPTFVLFKDGQLQEKRVVGGNMKELEAAIKDITAIMAVDFTLASTAQTRHGINPATGQPNPPVPLSTAEDLDRAVAAAGRAFHPWARKSLDDRRAAVHAFADRIEANKEGLAALLTREQGKPLNQATTEVAMALQWARGLSGLTLPETILEESEDLQVIQRYTPIGVCAAIVPWNYPLLLAIGKMISAVYTGNTVIVKPSPYTPYSDLKLAELATQCFPPGVVQALSGDDELGPMITEHPGIHHISFTGSTTTGRRVMASCAKTLKKVTLELGGNDPAIICDDVDIDAVVPKVAILCFLCCSQICMMIKRLYVHEQIYDEFRDKLVQFVQALKMGEGTEPDVFFGPVQNSMQFGKATDLLGDIKTNGLNTISSHIVPNPSGFFIPPTIVDNPPDTSRVVREEPFAPILPILKWSDETDVLARANDSEYGLGASVWCRDLQRARRMGDQLEAGSVFINTHFECAPYAPFGGHKMSGIGTELGVNGLVGYCNSQTLWLRKG
ncbi:Aldedh-domain-containing protein [Aspergillus sclerotiicarbonarius CBS 121057]|uniref:aldehyde dehydrogenase (NAD(+)) n=1 Tax=Aspergillus sclerotiicarbonarius (strain CBS 121057 / IBT 28362) TaxID=1448318 RepID=A0A319F6D1_ASPSB|nr:Aldedh-domain-containing protein [Aspergillus sclerotiicarbonarius CBS 121057]